jgi:hypothetical protein
MYSAQRNQTESPLLRMSAQIRGIISMDLDSSHHHSGRFDWDRLAISQPSGQIFAETARPYFIRFLLDNQIYWRGQETVMCDYTQYCAPSQMRAYRRFATT